MIRKGGTDGIIKSTGKPLVKYEKTEPTFLIFLCVPLSTP
jgi:hypothetical protein